MTGTKVLEAGSHVQIQYVTAQTEIHTCMGQDASSSLQWLDIPMRNFDLLNKDGCRVIRGQMSQGFSDFTYRCNWIQTALHIFAE